MGDSTIFLRELINKHEETFIKNVGPVITVISNFINRSLEPLSAKGPSRRILFTDSDVDALFLAAGIEKKEVSETIKTCKLIDSKWHILNNPFNIMCIALTICYYKNEKAFPSSKYKMSPHLITNLFITLRFYSSMQIRQFPYDPDEEIMDRTIDSLNNKFTLKKYNNMFETIRYISDSNFTNMELQFKKGHDKDIINIINNLANRLSSFIKNVSKEFYKNYKEHNKSEVESIIREDDEGDQYVGELTNVSSEIENSTRKIRLKVVADSTPNYRLLSLACKRTMMSTNKMQIIIDKIRESNDELLYKLLRNIIAYYIITYKKAKYDIKSENFITTMFKIYNVSNTKDVNVIAIKNILDELLKKYSTDYLKTSRVATVSNMRSCIYYYFVLYIAQNIS